MKKLLSSGIKIVFHIYVLISFIIIPYYNWQYAKENGFIKWLCFGEIKSTIKSFSWPYYEVIKIKSCKYYNTWSQEEIKNAQYLLQALNMRSEATKIINQDHVDYIITDSEETTLTHYLHFSLELATKTQDDILDKIHPELKDHFRNEFQKGMELQLSCLENETNDVSTAIKASLLQNQWVDWYNSHKKKMRIPSLS
jgi:hypothetical protein